MARMHSRLCFVFLVLLFAVSGPLDGVLAQSPPARGNDRAVQSDRSPEAAAAAAATARRMQQLDALARNATPDPESDVVLDQATLAVGADNSLLFRMRGRARPGQGSSFVWIADGTHNRYRIFNLDRSDTAERIAAYLRQLGLPASLDAIRTQVEAARSRRRALPGDMTHSQRENASATPMRPLDGRITAAEELELQLTNSCNGFIEGHIETWELASLFWGPFPLTRTYAFNEWVRWSPAEGEWVWATNRGGSCWSEPLSFAYTTWYTNSCSWYYPPIYDGFSDILVTGTYRNWDFGFDNIPTDVFQGIGLTHSNAYLSYNSFHFQDGEGVFNDEWGLALIWGQLWINPFSYTSCRQ